MAEPKQYQLVFQLGLSQLDFEEMIALENELQVAIGARENVDGHDLGSGEMNTFVLTDQPIRVFQAVRTLPGFVPVMPKLKSSLS